MSIRQGSGEYFQDKTFLSNRQKTKKGEHQYEHRCGLSQPKKVRRLIVRLGPSEPIGLHEIATIDWINQLDRKPRNNRPEWKGPNVMSDRKLRRAQRPPSEGPIRQRATIHHRATIHRLNVLSPGKTGLRPR